MTAYGKAIPRSIDSRQATLNEEQRAARCESLTAVASRFGVRPLVFFGGEALPVNRFLPGSVAKVRWDSPVKETLNQMIAEGHEHHLIWAYGDVRTELEEFCRLTGIRAVPLSRGDS